MDATRCHGLARVLSVALVALVTTSPTLRAKESSTLVFSDSSVVGETALETSPVPAATKRSAAGALVVVPERKAQVIAQPRRVQTASVKRLPRPTMSSPVAKKESTATFPQPAPGLAARSVPGPVQREVERPAEKAASAKAAYVQPVSHALPIKQAEEQEPESDPGAELLIEAHELSLHAAELQDYDELISLCQSAKRVGLEGEHLEYANTLMGWALNRRGQFRADAGDPAAADKDFEWALKHDPDNWRALHNRGVSNAQAGKFAEALDDFNRVVELNPLFAKAFANRATLFSQSGDLDIALADYQRACKLDPKLFVAQVGLGRTCHMLGRGEEALDAFNQALDVKPDSPDVICSRGDLFSDMGRYGEALADYAAAIDLNPEFAHAYRNGAWLLATCPDARYRDGANAIQGAERALEFGYGDRHVALDTLAAAHASAGQFEEAVRTLEAALKIAPYDARAAYRARLKLYLTGQSFLTDPPADLQHVVYEATDQ